MGSLADELDLTAEQQLAWRQMMLNIRSTCSHEGPGGYLSTLDLLEAAVDAQPAEHDALYTMVDLQLEAQRLATRCTLGEVLGFKAVLSPEQLAFVATRLDELHQERQRWRDAWNP